MAVHRKEGKHHLTPHSQLHQPRMYTHPLLPACFYPNSHSNNFDLRRCIALKNDNSVLEAHGGHGLNADRNVSGYPAARQYADWP